MRGTWVSSCYGKGQHEREKGQQERKKEQQDSKKQEQDSNNEQQDSKNEQQEREQMALTGGNERHLGVFLLCKKAT